MFLPVAAGVIFLTRSGSLRRWHPAGRGVVFFGQQVLQPSVLHLELGDAGLQAGVLLGGLSHRALEHLLALLLLHAEPRAGGGVAASSILFGGAANMLFLAQGGNDVVAGDLRAVFRVADLSIRRRYRGRNIRGRQSPRGMAQVIRGAI